MAAVQSCAAIKRTQRAHVTNKRACVLRAVRTYVPTAGSMEGGEANERFPFRSLCHFVQSACVRSGASRYVAALDRRGGGAPGDVTGRTPLRNARLALTPGAAHVLG